MTQAHFLVPFKVLISLVSEGQGEEKKKKRMKSGLKTFSPFLLSMDHPSSSSSSSSSSSAVPKAHTKRPEAEEAEEVQGKNLNPGHVSKKRKTAGPIDKNQFLFTETESYLENGLRKVKPYAYEYLANAKARWLGKSILEVFSVEFRDATPEYYKEAIRTGRLTINGRKVTAETKIRNGDSIGHYVLRYEPPVTADPIQIIEDTEDLLVINKPGSIPIHPAGRYRQNSITSILMREFGYKEVFIVHRLDRLTSGIVLFAKSKAKSQELYKQMTNKDIKKEYVCRVLGEFPESEEEIICEQPLYVASHKLALNMVGEEGKDSKTGFKRLSYNGRTSVVLCKPYTGRTHQIRVHLQFLGFPIVNDPLYCHPFYGPLLGKGGLTREEREAVVERFMVIRPTIDEEAIIPKDFRHPDDEASETSSSSSSSASSSSTSSSLSSVPPPQMSPLVQPAPEATPENATEFKVGQVVDKSKIAFEQQKSRRDPLPHELLLWLHAFKYSGVDWSYSTDLPEWAKSDFDDSELIDKVRPTEATIPWQDDDLRS